MKIHIVKQGDTLYQLAQKYGVSVDDIVAINPLIHNPDELVVGLKVKIPSQSKHIILYDQHNDHDADDHSDEQQDLYWDDDDDLFKQDDVPAEKVASLYDLPELNEMSDESMRMGHPAYANPGWSGLPALSEFAPYQHTQSYEQHPMAPQHGVYNPIPPMLATPLSTKETAIGPFQVKWQYPEVYDDFDEEFSDDLGMVIAKKKKVISKKAKTVAKHHVGRGRKTSPARKRKATPIEYKSSTPWLP